MSDILDQEILKKEIFEALGVAKMPPESQEEVLAAAAGPVIQSVTLAILEKLSADDKNAFKEASEAGESETIEKLILKNIPDSTAFISAEVKKAVAEFRTLFEQELSEA